MCRLRPSTRAAAGTIAEWACENCAPEAFHESQWVTIAYRVAGFTFRTLILAWLAATLAARVPRVRIAELTIPELVVGAGTFIVTLMVTGLLFWPIGGDYGKAYYTWGAFVPSLIYGILVAALFGYILYRWEPTRLFVSLLLLKLLDLLIPGAT